MEPTADSGKIAWSDNPGCFERHLQRKLQFPFLFSSNSARISFKDVEDARHKDASDSAELQIKVSQLISELKGQHRLPEFKAMLDKISTLEKKAAGIGGDATMLGKALRTGRETLIAEVKDTLVNVGEEIDPELFAAYSSLSDLPLHPIIAQLSRDDSPIKQSESSALLLTEEPRRIHEVMLFMSISAKKWVRETQREALTFAVKAIADGHKIPDVSAKLLALGIGRFHVKFALTFALTTAKLRHLFR